MPKTEFLIGTVALLMALTGCNGGSAPPPPPPAIAPPPPVSVAAAPQPAQNAARKGSAEPKKIEPEVEVTTRDWVVEPPTGNFEVATLEESESQRASYAVAPISGATAGTLEAFAPQPATPSNQSTLRLPTGFVPLPGPVTDTGWPQHIRCEKSGVEMALIPAQVTRVGSSSGPQETQPEHPAFVSAFYMDIQEVTLGAYLRYRDQVKAEKKNLLPAPSNEKGQPLEPVLGISWRDADLYAKAMGCELPTEAEWEAAGRGEQGFTYPWGEGRPVWSRERKPGQLTEVASYHTDLSRYGIFDLSGNAREWTQDWYQPDAFLGALERDGSPRQNWTGPAKSSPVGHRVIKGSQTGWELWARDHGTIAEGQPDVGFRCVLRIKQ